MEVEVLTTLFGVALAALVAACGAGFRWLRVDFRDLRNHVESRFNEQAMVTTARFAEVNGRLDRLETRFDGLEHKVDRLDGKVDRLEGKFDVLVGRFDVLERKVADLITVLARTGLPIEPRLAAPESPPAPEPTPAPESTAAPPPASATAAQSPEPVPGPTEVPGDESLQAAPPSEIAGLPRAPPATGGRPTAERPYWPPPPEPFGPTAAPA